MNKVTAAVLAAAMIGSMAMPVFAADETTQPSTNKYASGSTTVKYQVTESYVWTIHDTIDFDKDKGTNKTVSVTQDVQKEDAKVSVTTNKIGDKKKLVITAAGSGTGSAFTIANGGTVLPYTITKTAQTVDGTASTGLTTDITVNGSVLELNAGVNTGDATLKFTLSTTKSTAEVAGDYTGTVTYTAAVKPQ